MNDKLEKLLTKKVKEKGISKIIVKMKIEMEPVKCYYCHHYKLKYKICKTCSYGIGHDICQDCCITINKYPRY